MIGFYYLTEKDEFEYDVRGLLGSFFPGRELVRLPGMPADDEKDGFAYLLAVPDFSVISDRTERKNHIKRSLYRQLAEHTGRELPWGTLTGIRPVKRAMKYEDMDGGMEKMRQEYLVSDEKLQLAFAIARKEKSILRAIDAQGGYSLYIGIPFCTTTCLYCSFTSSPMGLWLPRMHEYLQTVFRELDAVKEMFGERCPDTIYIGGGTPTSLSPEGLEAVLSKLADTFDLTKPAEFTVEAGRPDSITPEKLRVLRRYPVSRISVNPQTMSDETLRTIGRRHSVAQFVSAYELARDTGFDNINMDIILGLPGERAQDVARTMERLRPLAPDSLTVHAMAVKRASRLKMEAEGAARPELSQQETEEMMRLAQEGARAMGLEPYYLYRQKNMAGNLENVGYARPGREGIYNILIMEEVQTIAALGAGTVSKAVFPDGLITRADNVKNVEQYMERIDEMIERKKGLFSK